VDTSAMFSSRGALEPALVEPAPAASIPWTRAVSDLRALREVVELRIALDLSVAEQLTDLYRDTENPELEGLVEEMRALASEGKPFPAADAAFHTALFARLPNRLLRQLAQAFWEIHTEAVPLLGLPPAEDILVTVDAHRDMLDALEAGDAEAYREAVIEHYRPLGRVLQAAATAQDIAL